MLVEYSAPSSNIWFVVGDYLPDIACHDNDDEALFRSRNTGFMTGQIG